MHYPHKTSKVKRARKIGFRARMRTKGGRKAINRKRRRYLKDLDAAADDFHFGRDRTDVMNEPRRPLGGQQAQNRPSE